MKDSALDQQAMKDSALDQQAENLAYQSPTSLSAGKQEREENSLPT
jgi:hypothetical protein